MDLFKSLTGKVVYTMSINTLNAKQDYTEKIESEVAGILENTTVDEKEKAPLVKAIAGRICEMVSLSSLHERLGILYEYEKNYLSLVKEYKEEIKFAANLQEDLRKERTKFFAESLREVSQTLKDAQVSTDVASTWLMELVNSYTNSLNLSGNLIDEHTVDTIGIIRKEAKKGASTVKGKGNDINDIKE